MLEMVLTWVVAGLLLVALGLAVETHYLHKHPRK